MKDKEGKFYEGFETWYHELQMTVKAVTYVAFYVFIAYVLVVILIYSRMFGFLALQYDLKFLLAKLLVWIDEHLGRYFILVSRPGEWHLDLLGHTVNPYDYVLLYNKVVLPHVIKFWGTVLVLLPVVEFAGLGIIAIVFRKRAKKKLHETIYLRGTKLIPAKELNKQLRKKFGKSRIRLTKHIWLPESIENFHIAILGATGTGKSTLIKSILYQIKKIRKKGDIGVIFDLKGEYLSAFYDETRDLIFNPVDARCVGWNMFADIKNPLEIQDFARAFIPQQEGKNTYFYDAAKDVLASILEIMWRKKEYDYSKIWNLITARPDELLYFLEENKHLGGAIGAKHIFKPDSPQTQGVMGVLMEHCRVFRLLVGMKPEISLREWIRTTKESWLFLPLLPQYSEMIAPLFTAIVNLLFTEVLSFPDYPERKTWFILDELGNLRALPKFSQLLGVCRSKNACVVIGTQTTVKLDAIYGQAIRKDILNNCNIKVLLRTNDPDSAKHMEEMVGHQEFEEGRKSYSMGVMDVRDGTTVTRQDVVKPVVMASEFAHLPNLTGVVKVMEMFPAKDEIPFRKFEAKVEPVEDVQRIEAAHQVEEQMKEKEESLKKLTGEKKLSAEEKVEEKTVSEDEKNKNEQSKEWYEHLQKKKQEQEVENDDEGEDDNGDNDKGDKGMGLY